MSSFKPLLLFLLVLTVFSVSSSFAAFIDDDGDGFCDADDANICDDGDLTDNYCTNPKSGLSITDLNCLGNFGRAFGDSDPYDCFTTGCYFTSDLLPDDDDLNFFLRAPLRVYPDLLGDFQARDVNVDIEGCNPGDLNDIYVYIDYALLAGCTIADDNCSTDCTWTPSATVADKYIASVELLDSNGTVLDGGSRNVLKGEEYVIAFGDCDDSNSSINPEASEECDLIDNDCDRLTDEKLENCLPDLGANIPLYGAFVWGLPLTFDASNTDCKGNCVYYWWDFNWSLGVDGTDLEGGTLYEVQRTYPGPDTYIVALKVENFLGAYDYDYRKINVVSDPLPKIVSPNGGENIVNYTTIQWNVTDPNSEQASFEIYYDTDTNPSNGMTLITDGTIRFPAGGVAVDSFLWSTIGIPDGNYYLYIKVVADGNVGEDWSDSFFTIGNTASVKTEDAPDLIVASISLGTPIVKEGDDVFLNAVIVNVGSVRSVKPFDVSLYKDHTKGPKLVREEVKAILDTNKAISVPMVFNSKGMAGLVELYVVVDQERRVHEEDELNNTSFIVLRIKERASFGAVAPAEEPPKGEERRLPSRERLEGEEAVKEVEKSIMPYIIALIVLFVLLALVVAYSQRKKKTEEKKKERIF